jgi:hypothetical protein
MGRLVFLVALGVLAVCGLSQAQALDVGDIRFCSSVGDGCVQQSGCDAKLQDGCEEECDGKDGKGSDACGGVFGLGMLGPSDGSEPWSAWVWAAPTYSSGLADVFGFSEGVNVGFRVTDALGIIGGVGFNHMSSTSSFGGNPTQILGTIGVQKFGNPDGGDVLERSSLWVLWDQSVFLIPDPFFGIDGGVIGLHQHQIRLMAGYVTGYHNEIGVAWSFPIGNDDFGAGALSPLGGPGYLTTAGTFIGAYAKRRVRETDVTATLGYSQGASGMAFGIGAERPVTERVNMYVDFKAGAGSNYAGSIGAAIPLGRGDTKNY